MRFVNRKTIIPLVLIIFLLFIIKNLISSIVNLRQNGLIVTRLETQAKNDKTKQEFLKEQLYYAKSNEFVDEQARDKLGMVKDGEHIIIVPQPTSVPQNSEESSNDPNWKKWWNLFF